MPKTLSLKTAVLLNLMHASNRISWDPTGVVSIDNNVVPGSNIIDLVHDVVRKRKNPRNPVGIHTFKQFLHEINIPKELISFQFGAGLVKHRIPKKSSNRIRPAKRIVKKRKDNILKNYKHYKL